MNLSRRNLLKGAGAALGAGAVDDRLLVVSAWEPYVRNFAPNIGNDYGGRLMNVWLDK